MLIQEGKLIYHLVPLDSLESIIKYNLISRYDLETNKIDYIDNADPEIIQLRTRLGLSKFIPFHFHIHTAYDTAVKKANIGKSFIYICLHRNFAKTNGFLILPMHPASSEQPELFEYCEGFEAIDWQVMELNQCDALKLGVDLRYHKQVRMAECLSPIPVPVCCFYSINVPNEDIKEYVVHLLDSYSVTPRPYINVMNWFV